jgi:hypothetical protein
MRKKIVGALFAFLGMTLLVQVVAMGATSVDPLFVCVRVNFDWRAPYADGSCPTYYVKVEIQKAGGGGGGGTAPTPQYLSSTAGGVVSMLDNGIQGIGADLPLSGFVENAPSSSEFGGFPPAVAQTLTSSTSFSKIEATFITDAAIAVIGPPLNFHAVLWAVSPDSGFGGAPTPLSCISAPLTGVVPAGTVIPCSGTFPLLPLAPRQRAWVQISLHSGIGSIATSLPFHGSVGIS